MADELAEWPDEPTPYVMAHTSTPKGREPAHADIPIQARSDPAAIAHVRAEVARIRRNGPCNVEHHVTLTNQTDHRALFTASFRGLAPAI